MRILILGGSGMLGHKLWQGLGARFPDTYATLRGTRSDYRHCGIFDDPRVLENVDAANLDKLSAALEQTAPDVIVNCVALTIRRESATGPAASILLNAWLPHRLAEWAAASGARLITVSTDCVFDGKKGGYTEQDAPDAGDLYGRTKALGEVAYGGALTLRTSFIGRELAHYTELLEWFLAQAGRTVKGFRGALYTGVTTLYCADLVGDVIEKFPHLRGLYQVASEVISKYDLLCLARDAFGIDVKIEPDDTVAIKRNLNGEKFRRATGLSPPSWRRMMSELAADPTPYGDWRRDHAV
jgi:dTDP-4-dehydrorhamnose reductase